MSTVQFWRCTVLHGCFGPCNRAIRKLHGALAYLSAKPRQKGHRAIHPTGLYPWKIAQCNDRATTNHHATVQSAC